MLLEARSARQIGLAAFLFGKSYCMLDGLVKALRSSSAAQNELSPDLDHEVSYAAMEDGVTVVAGLSQDKKVLAGAGGNVAVQLQIEVSQAGVQAQIPLLLGLALHTHLGTLVLCDNIDSCRGE